MQVLARIAEAGRELEHGEEGPILRDPSGNAILLAASQAPER